MEPTEHDGVQLSEDQAIDVLNGLLAQHDGDDRDGVLQELIVGLFAGTVTRADALQRIARKVW